MPRGGAARRSFTFSLTFSLAFLLALASACGRDEERAEDAVLSAAIERMRSESSLSAQDRRMRLVTIRDLPARSAAASEAKDRCLRAHGELASAEEAIFTAEAQMKGAAALPVLPAGVVEEVARAEELLKKAKLALPECDAAAARLALGLR
jgi:hypothetical protein